MDALRLAHLLALSAWGGLVLAEIVIELSARSASTLRAAARFHYAIDLLVEAPLLAVVLATGVALASRAWPMPPLLTVKVCAGLAAIGANAACVALVVLRRRHLAEGAALLRYRRRIVATALVGVPFGLLAAILGLAFFMP